MKTMLLSFAHPDDESFTCGGVIAKYVANGWKVHLLCATSGEAGNSGPYEIVSRAQLGAIRKSELEKAAETLGISTVTVWDYKDGGLAKLEPGNIENKLLDAMLEVQPDVVITFDPTGISNHPDHIALCIATTFSFQKYTKKLASEIKMGNRTKRTEDDETMSHAFAIASGEVYEPRLYYACMPESIAKHLVKEKVLPKESFGKPWLGTEDKFITTVIDVTKYKKRKVDALSAHQTQRDDTGRFFSYPKNPLLTQEFFILRMQGVHEVFMGKHDRVANKL